MTADLRAILDEYRRAGLLVDTNILLLYCVGQVRAGLIGTFKRTKQFTPADFNVLVEVWAHVGGRITTTPTVLAEVSNLLGQLAGPDRTHAMAILAGLCKVLPERYAASGELADGPTFVRFGLTDAAVADTAAAGLLVLSDDLRLTSHLTSSGLRAINFNHLRAI